MMFYTMGFNSCNVSNRSMLKNNYVPEIATRNHQSKLSFSNQTTPVEISVTSSITKIPVPPPMPIIPIPPPMPMIPIPPPMPSTCTSLSSVVPPVPSVPPVPPIPLALSSNMLDECVNFSVTKTLLKTVALTLTPPSDTPKKIKKPQCMIDSSKKKLDAVKTAVDNSSAATVPKVPEVCPIAVQKDSPPFHETPEIMSVSLGFHH